jgi:conjugative relaxase-like TrwC/TraI family protein
VLTIHRLTSNRADYYLSDLARELPPPLGPAQRGGFWVGRAAPGLGLEGVVDRSGLEAVLSGRHPATGHQLRSTRATVLAYDITFSAPKSASVLFGLGGEEVARQVQDGHTEAVFGALAYMDARAVSATRQQGVDREVICIDGLVAGAFTHGANRNADPHLHTHVVMANLAHGEDGRWSALDQRGIWAHRAAIGAVYDAHLRFELTVRLGVQWTQTPFTSAEISGLSPIVLGEFSSRAADIARHQFEHNVHSPRGRRVAWAATRPAKVGGMPFEEIVPQWQQRAAAVLATPHELTSVLGHRRPERATLSEHQFAGVLSVAPDGGARRRDVVAAFAQSARHGAPVATVQQLTDTWAPEPASVVGVAETVRRRDTVVPGPHLLRALGPRPLDVGAHSVWREAAQCIDDYRQRWQVVASETLGVELCQADWPTVRMVDHLRTTNLVQAARTRLGRREPMMVELGRGR